jgi:hypothetical protein
MDRFTAAFRLRPEATLDNYKAPQPAGGSAGPAAKFTPERGF